MGDAAATGRPRVTWVFGSTLDGRVAAPDGSSRWISSRPARADAHRLRAAHDAVLVGSGAARIDDPHLGLRHGVAGRPPLRVVLDARASIVGAIVPCRRRRRPDAAWSSAPTRRSPPLPARVAIARVPVDDRGRLDLRRRPRRAGGARDVRSVLVEGGPTIAASFLRAGLVDDVVGYVRAARPRRRPAAARPRGRDHDRRPAPVPARRRGRGGRRRADPRVGGLSGRTRPQPLRRRPSSARGDVGPRSRRASDSARRAYSSVRL